MIINKRFTFLFLASLLSTLGGSLSYIAIYWVFSESTSLTSLAVLTVSYFLARFVFFMVLSPITDRYQPNTLMRFTMIGRGVLLLIYAALIYFLSIDLMWLLIMVVLQTALEALYYPASSKMIVKVVEEDDLSRANAYLSMIDRTGILVGFFIGGAVVAFWGLDTILMVEGLAYLFGAFMVSLIALSADELDGEKPRRNYFQEWKEGLAYIGSNKWMLGVLGLAVCSNIAIAPQITLLAPYASEVLKGDAMTFSTLEIASIVGGFASGFLLSKIRIKRVALTFSLACMLEAVLIIFIGLSSNHVIAMIWLAAIGFAITLFNIPFSTILQKYVPQNLLGRVRASLVAVSTGASSIGYFATGYVADYVGVSKAMLCFGGVGLAGILIILLFRPLRSIEEINKELNATVSG